MSNSLTQLRSILCGRVKQLCEEYIDDLKTSIETHTFVDRVLVSKITDEESKNKLVKFLEDRQKILKLLVLLWKQLIVENPNKMLTNKFLERHDENAMEFLEYLNDLTNEGIIEEGDYLKECDFFKVQRQRINSILAVAELV